MLSGKWISILIAVAALAGGAGACSKGPAAPVRASDSVLAVQRASCGFRAGAPAADTIGKEHPIGADIPVDHVFVLLQENRSFDHYFSSLAGADGARADATNPDADGGLVHRYHQTEYCSGDTAHGWTQSHTQWNDGGLDGFVVTSGRTGRIAMGYFDESDLPFYYGLARNFATSDRFFCSLLGPTLPNRMFALAGTSFGLIQNVPPPADAPNVFEALLAKGIDWKVYGQRTPSAAMFLSTTSRNINRFLTIEDFERDAAANTLPPFAFIEPRYLGTGATRSDEHPPGDIQMGQAFVARVVKTLMASPAWKRSVLFFSYDEHGGYYDHVSPPKACTPGGLMSDNTNGTRPMSEFDRYGFRVPFFAISPYSKRGLISHVERSHDSILRFVEARFGLAALSDRTANALPPYELFDFANPPNLVPPTLPEAVVDPVQLSSCMERFPEEFGL